MENKKIKCYDLTIPQENIWLIEQVNENTNINQIYGTLFINQKMDLELLKLAINRMIENNDALRIRITKENSIPKQFISEYEYDDIPVYFVDDDNNEKIQEIIRTIGLEHINILNHKLYDFRIIYCPNCVYLCVKMHHIIADAWSMAQLFVEHFGLFYEQVQNNLLSEKKPSYLNYIEKNEAYKNSEKYLKDQKFWEKYVQNLDCKNEFEIPKDKKCKRIAKNIDTSLYTKIENFCKENNITEYSFFLGILSTYFSKLFSNENLVIGTPFLNRKKADKELDIMGMFVATLPLHIKVSSDLNFVDLCKQVSSTNMSCFKHSSFPYHEIQKEYTNVSGNHTNLYEIVFSYQMNNLEEDFDNAIYKNTWYANDTQVNPLFISYMNHFGEHQLCYDYMVNIFQEQDITLLHERLITVIKQVLKNNNSTLSNITILSDSDITLLKEFNNTGDFISTNDTIISRFEKIVNKNKSKIALKYNDIEITYNELNKKANSVANTIIKKKIKKGSAVSIIFNKSPEMLISMLGIMKAGCYYIAILPEEEQSRAEYIIKDSESVLLITEKKYSTQISTNILQEQILFDDLLGESCLSPEVNIKPNDLCYLIYTSGSTGVPKGVKLKHENVISFMDCMNLHEDMKFLPDDIHFSILKCSFDAFSYDIYSTFLNGAKLVLLPKQLELNPEAVVKLIEKEKVTKFLAVPTWLYQISYAAEMYQADVSSIRFIPMGGEAAKPQKLKYLNEKFPNTVIHNVCGPTEVTIYVTSHKINHLDVENNYAPIGKLIPCARAVIMDYNSQEVLPIGAKGELVIYEDDTSIKNISNGYLNLEDKTKERYIKFYNPLIKKMVKGYRTGDTVRINENLELDYLGRIDDFKKVNGGYLVSLTEVEKRIEKILGSSVNVAVVSIPIRNINSIVLFISKKSDSTNITISDIKEELDSHLTFFMKPKQIIELDKFPVNTNGKINKRLLASMATDYIEEKNDYTQPTNTTEKKIYDIIKEITNCDFSITDDFEDDLGIDSLNMATLYSKLNNSKISVQDLYNYPTVKDLAYLLKKEFSEDESNSSSNIQIQNASSNMNLNKILLTGTTGFVGSHLLKELTENNEVQKIYCIVRQKLNLSSEERFDKIIHDYFDEDTCRRIKKKTIVLNGDLRKDNLGLSENTYNKIFKEIQTIINTAANVKHIGKYSTFYMDNVETVNNLIRICLKFNISLAHISTLSLNGYNNKHVNRTFTENTLNINQIFHKNPYLISKYEAETSILKSISENNLNAKIFRIGNIMPRTSDGTFQLNYNQNGFLLALNALSNLRTITNKILNFKTYLTPVDECCNAISTILSHDYCNTIYHIESNKSIKLSSIINVFKERNIDFSIVTDDAFYKKLSTDYSIGVEYIKSVFYTDFNKYEKNITLEILNDLGFDWTKISKDYFENITNIALKMKP